MVTTTNTNGTSANGAISGLATGNTGLQQVDFNTFLKLLVAQLKNQDPLNPLDGTQFTGQIAQFSTLEQQINGNNLLQQLVAQRDFGQQNLAANYLNKLVLAPGTNFVKTGDLTEVGYSLAKTASKVEVDIIDNKTGAVVKSFVGDGTEGNHIVDWDGKGDDGQPTTGTSFTLRIKATDADGKVIASNPMTYGQVASVLNDNGTAALILTDGRQIDMADIMVVTNSAASSGN